MKSILGELGNVGIFFSSEMVFLFFTSGTGPDLTDFPLGISPDRSLKEHVCR
jgi:hypothetical protein